MLLFGTGNGITIVLAKTLNTKTSQLFIAPTDNSEVRLSVVSLVVTVLTSDFLPGHYFDPVSVKLLPGDYLIVSARLLIMCVLLYA